MKKNVEKEIMIFKALSDNNRLQIIDMLSCGELCACEMLKKLNITQPTLSHHMKTLIDSNLVTARKEANWMYYKLNKDIIDELTRYIKYISSDKDDCICKKQLNI
ncbi:MAG: ArsR/SmtB family transcription factor [Ignavibacteriales bacterium]